MLFGVLRVSPEVKLAQSHVVPGSLLEGTLYVTCTAKEPVTVQAIWVKFAGAATLNTNVTQYKRVREPSISGDGEFLSNGAAAAADFGDGAAHRFETVPQADHISLTLAKSEVCVRAGASEFKPGVHAVPFALRVPSEHNGVPLPPSADAPGLGLCVRYSVTGVLKLASLVHRKNRQVVQMRAATETTAAAETTAAKTTAATETTARTDATGAAETASQALKVGTWEKSSTRAWPALRYYLGANTAARESEVVLQAALQDVDIGAGSAYLQDALRLTVARAGGGAVQPLLVDCVRVELLSEAHDLKRRVLASTQRSTIMSAHNIDFPVDIDAAPKADITAVLSGARVPSTAAPTLALPALLVRHWLCLRVGLRSRSPDGTRQAVAHAKIQLPVRILASAP